MKKKSFTLTSDYIELIKLLKLIHVCNSGGEAKQIVDSGLVKVNGVTELRKRAKITQGNILIISQLNYEIEIL